MFTGTSGHQHPSTRVSGCSPSSTHNHPETDTETAATEEVGHPRLYAIIHPGGTAGSPYTGAMSVITCPVCGINIPRPGGRAMVVSLHITSCRRSPRSKAG